MRCIGLALVGLVLLLASTNVTTASALSARIDGGRGSALSEPEIAVDPSNPARVLVVAKNLSTTGRQVLDVFRSTDGGASFSGGHVVAGTYLGSPADVSDPVTIFNRLGTAYFGHLVWRYPGAGFESLIGVLASSDSGASFGAPSAAVRESNTSVPLDFGAPPRNSVTHDKEWLAVDSTAGPTDGNVYAAWVRVRLRAGRQLNRIAFTRSVNGGASFAPVQLLSSTRAFALGPQVVVSADAKVHVVWVSLTRSEIDRRATVMVATSSDGGATFAPPRVVARFTNSVRGVVAGENLVALASSGTGLLACWSETLSPRSSRATCSASPDGLTWSTPRRVATSLSGVQTKVSAIGDGSRYWVLFLQQGGCQASVRAYRLDAAARPTRSVVLARRSRAATEAVFLGDYFGLDAVGGRIFATFALPRGNRTAIYVRAFAGS